jgi:hypothetical protein
MYGAKLGQGASLRGYWYDVDNGVTEGNRLACTIIVTVDESGNACTGKYKTKDGGSGEWTATRFNDAMKFARTDGKITTFAYKSKPTFEALTVSARLLPPPPPLRPLTRSPPPARRRRTCMLLARQSWRRSPRR